LSWHGGGRNALAPLASPPSTGRGTATPAAAPDESAGAILAPDRGQGKAAEDPIVEREDERVPAKGLEALELAGGR
jgi:hypothetical protein